MMRTLTLEFWALFAALMLPKPHEAAICDDARWLGLLSSRCLKSHDELI